ncbi:hypothetical protein AMB3_3084 [plant metagenome]
MRGLSFVELIEMLEFSRLRLDPPVAKQCRRDRPVIGTQEWMLSTRPRKRVEPSAVYVCSTLTSLHESLLPPEDAMLDFSVPTNPTPAARSLRDKRMQLFALARRSGTERPSLPYLRVDLASLIQRVIVPKEAPPDLFELVDRVVRARIWVDVCHGTPAR